MPTRRDWLKLLAALAGFSAGVYPWERPKAANAPFGSWTTVTTTSNTILVTGTFQQALAPNSVRRGCIIQNNGSHTMYLYFAGNTTTLPPAANTSFSLQLTPGQTIQCLQGSEVVLQDMVAITGTAGDSYAVNSQ